MIISAHVLFNHMIQHSIVEESAVSGRFETDRTLIHKNQVLFKTDLAETVQTLSRAAVHDVLSTYLTVQFYVQFRHSTLINLLML